MDIPEIRLRLAKLRMSQRVLQAGTGPPLVLLHGNPDNADEWRGVIRLLAPSFRCIAPDLPGYGRSDKLPASFRYRIRDQITFLDSLLAAAGVTEPVTLVVHDIGAIMGIPWAAANLDRLRALLITNTVAFEGFQWFNIARRWGSRSLPGRLGASLLMVAIGLRGGARFRQVFGTQNPQLPAEEIDRIVASFALNSRAKAACLRQFREMMKRDFFNGFDRMNRLITARVPVKVLWGDGDPYVPTECAQRFGTGNVRILPGAGHWTPIVAADEIALAVRSLSVVPPERY